MVVMCSFVHGDVANDGGSEATTQTFEGDILGLPPGTAFKAQAHLQRVQFVLNGPVSDAPLWSAVPFIYRYFTVDGPVDGYLTTGNPTHLDAVNATGVQLGLTVQALAGVTSATALMTVFTLD